jgi:hypothetical protein
MDGFNRLSARDRRAVFIGLGVLTAALVWMGAVRPYRASLAALRERIASERALLAREEALLRVGPTLPDSLGAAEVDAQRAQLRLVRAANIPLAEAELTKYLEGVAEHSRVLLKEMRGVEPADSIAPVGRPIRLAVNGESDLQGVLTFLHRIEEGPLLVRVLEMSVERVPERQQSAQAQQANNRARRAGANAPRNVGAVQFSILIEAYAPPDASGASPSRAQELHP